jgi:hypothetical protein
MNFIERYYLQTRSPFAELTRFFFAGLLRPEWMSNDGSAQTRLIQIVSALLCAGVFFPRELRRQYAYVHSLPDPRQYLIQYSSDWLLAMILISLVIGVWTVMQWRSLFPSRRDHLILTPQPVTRGELFGAKLAALLIFVTLFIVVLTLTCGLTLPAVATGRWESRPLLLRTAAFLTGSVGLCYFLCLSLLAVQGILMAILPVRWFESASFLIQSILVAALVCGFALFSYLPARAAVAGLPRWLDWFPPGWFWALAERIAGARDPVRVHLAQRAEAGLAIAAFIAATSYLLSYIQFTRYALEISGLRRKPFIDWAASLARPFRLPQACGVSEFIMRTLLRSRQQKLIIVLIAAVGVALAVDGWFSATYAVPRYRTASTVMREAVVAMPLTLSFFSMLAVRRAFRIPAELPASWIFRFFETREATPRLMSAVFLTFVGIAGVPPLVACIPIEWSVFRRDAIAILLVESLMMVAFAEYLFRAWCSIPFTFLMNPARRHFIQSASIHLGEFTIYSLISGFIVLQGTVDHSAWILQAAIACAAAFWFDRQRRAAIANAPLEFTEPASDTIEVLRLLD